jgi:hypothetical protein
MPIHDWTRLEPGDFHHFHQTWVVFLTNALNGGLLPPEYMAMAEQVTGRPIPDVYAKRKNRIVIRHGRGKVVAVIEIVSPGNKDSQNAIRSFVEKAADFLEQGVHLLIVDLFPPTPRDPHGIHKAIWDQFTDEPCEAPPGKTLTVAAYLAGESPTAYVEPVGLGDELPSLPIFLSEDYYVPAPLESTYQQAWAVFPAMLKELMEQPAEQNATPADAPTAAE